MFFFETVYVKTALPQDLFAQIQGALDGVDDFQAGGTLKSAQTGELDPIRDAMVSWLDPQGAAGQILADFVALTNQMAGWHFALSGLSALQYSKYPEGGFYDWHRDEHDWTPGKWGANNGNMRKLSFSLGLNDGYTGGEMELDVVNPTAGTQTDLVTLAPGELLVFHSDTLHRVRPVTQGVRTSLVGWMMGPPFV